MIKATMEKEYENFESLFFRFLKERNLLVAFDKSLKTSSFMRLTGHKYTSLSAFAKMLVHNIKLSVTRYEIDKKTAVGPFATITDTCPYLWNNLNFILQSCLINNKFEHNKLCVNLCLDEENGDELKKLTLNNISCLLTADFINECLRPFIPDAMRLELMKREARYCSMSRPTNISELKGGAKDKWDWLMSFY